VLSRKLLSFQEGRVSETFQRWVDILGRCCSIFGSHLPDLFWCVSYTLSG